MNEIIIIAILYFALCGIFARFVARTTTSIKNLLCILLLPVWFLFIFIAALFVSQEKLDKAAENALNNYKNDYK